MEVGDATRFLRYGPAIVPLPINRTIAAASMLRAMFIRMDGFRETDKAAERP